MMGPLSTAILAGCLQALRWLFWLVSALLLILVVTQSLRGDDGAQPLTNVIIAVAFALAGFVSERVARAILRTQGN